MHQIFVAKSLYTFTLWFIVFLGVPSAAIHATGAISPGLTEAHEKWLVGAPAAARSHGCSEGLITQLPSESVAEVVKLFALTGNKETCIILQPVSTDPDSMRYSFASGGKVDGLEIRYLSDVGKLRIWNGVEVGGK